MKKKLCLIMALIMMIVCIVSCEGVSANKPKSPEDGSKVTNTETGSGENNTESSRYFSAQYARTDGWDEDTSYPAVKIIRSQDELTAYYQEYMDVYYLERRDKFYADSVIGFLDAADKYTTDYFSEGRILILVLMSENSGDVRHEVTEAGGIGDALEIKIIRDVPEAGTLDMAMWHIFVEPGAGVNVADESKIHLTIDFKDITPHVIGHPHKAAAEPQTVDDPYVGYCGNTMTTVYFGDGRKSTFMAGNSVTLTDILLNLNYSPSALCRCASEYKVDTEFGTGYGISITGAFVRCDKGQASLTAEQVESIREIISWAEKDAEIGG